MRRLFPLRLLLIPALILGTLILPTPPSVLAQSADATNGLEISPVLVELNAEKGNTYTVTIKVRNVTTSNLFFDTSVDDFGAKDESGSPSILLEESAEPLATSIKSWVRSIPSFSLAPTEAQTIKATVSVPASAEPGGHYGVIRFAGHEKESDKGNVGLIASAGTLLLVSVKGDAKEALDLASFEATNNDGKAGVAFESGPITFVSRFKNTGTVHVKPIGQIEVKDAFGKSVATLPVNSAEGNVLPDSTRRFESKLDQTWLFGHYTADISIAYGNTGQAIVRTLSFWVIPWKIILAALLIVATIIYVLRVLIKRYNSYIISRNNANNRKSSKKRK